MSEQMTWIGRPLLTSGDMSSDAHEAVRAVIARISAAWQERRYDDVRQMFADGMVFALPGFQRRLEGRDSIVASYRKFMDRVALDVLSRGSACRGRVGRRGKSPSYWWEMAWVELTIGTTIATLDCKGARCGHERFMRELSCTC
jgi:hypothetical protein